MMRKYIPLLFWTALSFILCLVPGPDVLEGRLSAEAEAPIDGLNDLNASPDSSAAKLSAPNTESPGPSSQPSTMNQTLVTLLSENVKTKERLGHLLPLVGIGFCFIRIFFVGKKNLWMGVLATGAFSALISLFIELSQMLLPEWFHRGFALDDIGISLVGGLVGGLGAIGWARVKTGNT